MLEKLPSPAMTPDSPRTALTLLSRLTLGSVIVPLAILNICLGFIAMGSLSNCPHPVADIFGTFSLGSAGASRQPLPSSSVQQPVPAPVPATGEARGQQQVLLPQVAGAAPRYPPLPACARGPQPRMAKSWIMVFMGHSGSTAIVSELMQHSSVHFELPEPVDHGERENNGTLAYEYVRDFFQRGIQAGKTPGFKMRPKHILDPAMQDKWRQLVREFDTRIIWQYRENVFKQAVGEYTHRYLNDSSVVEGIDRKLSQEERCKIGAGCRFRVENFDFFHSLLRDAVNNDRLISRAVNSATGGSDQCILALPYETYLYDREGVMRRLFKFLGIKEEMHAPTKAKATRDSMCAAVANYGDLCREFYGCPSWRYMMDDLRNDCYCAKYNAGPGTSNRCGIEITRN